MRKWAIISRREAERMQAAGALLLDVRSPEEFAGGHMAGSLSLPVERIAGSIGGLAAKERVIIVYCATGERSRTAAAILARLGFERIYVVSQ